MGLIKLHRLKMGQKKKKKKTQRNRQVPEYIVSKGIKGMSTVDCLRDLV